MSTPAQREQAKREEKLESMKEQIDEGSLTVRQMTDEEKAQALSLLRDPQLVARITTDFTRAGVVGEATNCLVGYLAATSRKLSRPLAISCCRMACKPDNARFSAGRPPAATDSELSTASTIFGFSVIVRRLRMRGSSSRKHNVLTTTNRSAASP